MPERKEEKSARKGSEVTLIGGSPNGHVKKSPTTASLNSPMEAEAEAEAKGMEIIRLQTFKMIYDYHQAVKQMYDDEPLVQAAATTDLEMKNEVGWEIEDETSARSTHEDDMQVTEMYKDRDLYLAARKGKLIEFRRLVLLISRTDPSGDIFCRLSASGNTFLHVAAKYNNQELVRYLAEIKKPSLLAKNFNGETALHLAVKGGVKSMLEVLVELNRVNVEKRKSGLLMANNEMGNTALHEALLSGHHSIATYLISINPRLSYQLNNKGESAIYLAAKAGLEGCVSLILQLCTEEERLNDLFKKKSPIKAAIEKEDRGITILFFAYVTMDY